MEKRALAMHHFIRGHRNFPDNAVALCRQEERRRIGHEWELVIPVTSLEAIRSSSPSNMEPPARGHRRNPRPNELSSYGFNAGPVTGTTRKVLEKKLEAFRKGKVNESKHRLSLDTQLSKRSVSKSPATKSRSPVVKSRQLAEESDTELDLSVPPTPPSVNASPKSSLHGSGKRYMQKRPQDNFASPKVTRNIFQDSAASISRIEDDDEEDNHAETSRILSPSQRFVHPDARNRFSSSASSISTSFGKKTLGLFSESFTSGSLKASSYKDSQPSLFELQNLKHGNYKRGYNDKFISQQQPHRWWQTVDISWWILTGLATFTTILAAIYVATAHPETLQRGNRILKGTFVDMAFVFYKYAILPVLVVASVLVISICGYFMYIKYKQLQEREKQKFLELVERIIYHVQNAGVGGIAVPIIRDTIMEAARRTPEETKLWQKTVDFINECDSRIRSDIREINGVECMFWYWVPTKDTNLSNITK
uniref:LEM domain-containing protein n=1 Tax=Acrobeloides nanus TaxID=290746 RepID=A0A914CBW4_9BILA